MTLKLTGTMSITGSLAYNTTFGDIGDIGVFMGGMDAGTKYNNIDYITISSAADATDFGDLLIDRRAADSIVANSTAGDRAVSLGGLKDDNQPTNAIDFITVSSPGNASDFGDITLALSVQSGVDNGSNDIGLSVGGINAAIQTISLINYINISSEGNAATWGASMLLAKGRSAGCSNKTNERALIGGGWTQSGDLYRDEIEYLTISTPATGISVGNLVEGINGLLSGTSNGINDRGIWFGGYAPTASKNVIQYSTITSLADSTDFGDLSTTIRASGGCSNGPNERAVTGGGYTGSVYLNSMEYVTISSLGNSGIFGDITLTRRSAGGASNA